MALSKRQQQDIGHYVALIEKDLRKVVGRIDEAAAWRAVQAAETRAEIDAVVPTAYLAALRTQANTTCNQIHAWLESYLGEPSVDPVTAQEEALNAERDAYRAAETARIETAQSQREAAYFEQAAKEEGE